MKKSWKFAPGKYQNIIHRARHLTCVSQGLSAAPNAGKIKMWVDFYARLPKGPAPEFKPKGLWQRYQHKYFDGDNASAARKRSSGIDRSCHV